MTKCTFNPCDICERNQCNVCILHSLIKKDIETKSTERGHWEHRGFYGYNCSCCGALNDIETNFCPNCGERLKGE